LKALSLTQPMAWAIFNGKDIENRTWSTSFRGRIYIHASKGFNGDHYCEIVDVLGIVPPKRENTIHGALIGEVDIIDCVANHGSLWFTGPWGFVLANPMAFTTPIPCRGMLKFFTPKPIDTTDY